jgi:hypothetical protein
LSGNEYQSINCNRYESQTSQLDGFITETRSNSGITKQKALYFRQGYFMTAEIIEKLFDSFDKIFGSHFISSKSALVNYSLPVIDNSRFDASINKTKPYEFAFTIKSQAEFEYARMLRIVYKQTIEPYFRKNNELIKKLARNFDRAFILTGSITNDRNGKTIHDTSSTFDLNIHTADNVINENEKSVDFVSGYRYSVIAHNIGHLSHFRSFFNFNYKSIPMSSLYLDLNYFKCYFLPIIEQFSKSL